MHGFTLFLILDATRWRVSEVTATVKSEELLSICLYKRIGKCILTLILASEVRTRCQVVFNNEHSLHLWQRYRRCTSTKDNRRTWAIRLQHGMTSMSSVQSERFCMLTNPIRLYWIAIVSKYFNLGCAIYRSLCCNLCSVNCTGLFGKCDLHVFIPFCKMVVEAVWCEYKLKRFNSSLNFCL
jgi:hypothetical protein